MLAQDPVVENIIVARMGLFMRHPFFGNIATRMRVIDASEWCSTAATDFYNLYYNRDFFASMTPRQIEFVIAHEVLHVVFDHFTRKEHRNHKLWNIASDYCVNGALIREGIGEAPEVNFFYDKKYDEWTAEQVYNDLVNNVSEEMLAQMGQMLDEHLDDSGDGGSEDGKGDGRPKLSEEEKRKMREDIRSAIIEAATASAGSLPGCIDRLVKELTESKINWRDLLTQQIQSTVKADFTFNRPNRKSHSCGAILPGSNVLDTIDVCVAIDTSGSISDAQIADFLGEIKGIMSTYQDFQLKVWCFDTEVHAVKSFDQYNADEIEEYKAEGGGGTTFTANWDFMKENDITPKLFVMITDGWCDSNGWGDDSYCDTIFIIHSNPGAVPPFGQYAYYEDAL